ncbi:MAG: hypothetical protein GY787_24890 [Alteromonadales bacterium]|nr:hypothetical protein [Alteromonadales bacterium]
MDFKKFAKTSEATMKMSDDYVIDLYHAGAGIVTEVKELCDAFTYTNTYEELGDICWFLALVYKRIPFDFGNGAYSTNSKKESLEKLMSESIELLNLIKRHNQYEDKNIDKIKYKCSCISTILVHIAVQSDYSVGDIFTANIIKLQKKRYKGGYNNFDAINRNTREEYDAMENN